MRTLQSITALTASLLLLVLAPSCIAVVAAAGVAGVAYVNGDLEARLEAGPQKVVDASVAALKEMEIPIQSSDSSGVDGRVVGRTALKKIEITVKRATDTSSQIAIRIDTFGDEAMSRQILDKIKSKL